MLGEGSNGSFKCLVGASVTKMWEFFGKPFLCGGAVIRVDLWLGNSRLLLILVPANAADDVDPRRNNAKRTKQPKNRKPL